MTTVERNGEKSRSSFTVLPEAYIEQKTRVATRESITDISALAMALFRLQRRNTGRARMMQEMKAKSRYGAVVQASGSPSAT